MATPGDPLTVASYGTAGEVEAARAFLEEGGIPASVRGLALEVARADAARALEALRARVAAAREAAEEALLEDEADAACIACGARIPEYLERCPACGFSFA